MDRHDQHADPSADHSSSSDITKGEKPAQDMVNTSSEVVTPPRPEVNLSRVLVNVTGGSLNLYSGNPSLVMNPPHTNEAPRPHMASPTPLHEEIGLQEPNRIYERHMLTKVRGYPLWLPEGDLNMSVGKRRVGISIGDVGMVASDGYFSYLFNILLPANDPLQPQRLPEGYTPIKSLSSSAVSRVKKYKANSALTSLSVRKVPGLAPGDNTRTEQKFELSSSKGAVLALPDGAQSYDLQEDVVSWTNYMCANLGQWYKYTIGTLGRNVRNGDIRLITGCDKTTFWGVAVAERPSFAPEKCWLRFLSPDAATSDSEVHTWDYSGVVSSRTGLSRDEIRELDWDTATYRANQPSQCVCVRSMTRTLPKDEWRSISKEFGLEQSMDGDDIRPSASPTGSTSPSSSNNVSSTRSSGEFVRGEKPHQRLYTNYHPSDLVNQMLMALSPCADSASCIDSDWCDPLQRVEHSDVEYLPLTSVTSTFDATYMLCTVFLGADINNVEGCAQLKTKPLGTEPVNVVWQKLCSLHTSTKSNVETHYRSDDFATDLLFIFDAFIEFFYGIQTLKNDGHARLLDDFDCWTWPFFGEAFRLLDAVMTGAADWLLDHDEESSVPSSTSATTAALRSYKNFRLEGHVQDLQTCANTLRSLVTRTAHSPDSDAFDHLSPPMSETDFPGVNDDVDIGRSDSHKRKRLDKSREVIIQRDSDGRSYASGGVLEDVPESSQGSGSRSVPKKRPLIKRLADLKDAHQSFIVNGERWVKPATPRPPKIKSTRQPSSKFVRPNKRAKRSKNTQASAGPDEDNTTVPDDSAPSQEPF
ncbi:hypothetical protein BJ165DRAFT_128796 [Panaeolus papilionaceus]|nr:hypothetical protein BJ165DRAFT_128796 [Panaeolus papilionaceus]